MASWFFTQFFWDKRKKKPTYLVRQALLKDRIHFRLMTEDYTCRLPRPKVRVRYKLRKYSIVRDNKTIQVWQ